MVEGLPMAARRRRAKTKLQDAKHDVTIRGPEGEQRHYDEKGKRVTSKSRVEFDGYKRYLTELMTEAGEYDPEFEKLVREIKAQDAFWGEGPTLSANDAVVDGDS